MSLQSLPIDLLTALMDILEEGRNDAARLIQRMVRGLRVRYKLTDKTLEIYPRWWDPTINPNNQSNHARYYAIKGRNHTLTSLLGRINRHGQMRSMSRARAHTHLIAQVVRGW